MKNRRVKRPKNLRLFAIAILAVAILYIAQFDIHWDFTEPTVQIDTELAIPDYSGQAYVIINDNMPYFDDADKNTNTFESYSDLDSLGRCGVAYANVSRELMPTKSREKKMEA